MPARSIVRRPPGPTSFNGQSFSASTNSGPWGVFVSGGRQMSNMRLEPVVMDQSSSKILNFHNDGTDYFGFGKLQYTPGTRDVFDLELNMSQTRLAIPFDSTGGAFQNDHQRDMNSFVNLGWRHQFGDLTGDGRAARTSSPASSRGARASHYNPDPNDEAQFVFYPNTSRHVQSRRASQRERRRGQARLRDASVDATWKSRSERCRRSRPATKTSRRSTRPAPSGPQSNSDLSGHDIGVYGQTTYAPREWVELRTGVRYDTHNAPFVGTQSQVSPRVRLSIFPSTSTTAYVYYGRQFMPTNIEDLRAITSAAQGGEVNQGTLPERDDFFEAGLIQRIPQAGHDRQAVRVPQAQRSRHRRQHRARLVDRHRRQHRAGSHHGPRVRARIPPGRPAHRLPERGAQPRVRGRHDHRRFLPRRTAVDLVLRPRPRSTVVDGRAARRSRPAVSFSAARRSTAPASRTASIRQTATARLGRGLFDFNKGIHVDPNTIFNLSGGYTFVAGRTVLQPEIYVENAFNKQYFLKGAFFSGASVGRPRSVQLRMKATF